MYFYNRRRVSNCPFKRTNVFKSRNFLTCTPLEANSFLASLEIAKSAFNKAQNKLRIYICYLPAGRSVLGKLCQRSWVRPEAAGRRPYPRPRAQFFPIRTDLGGQITCLLFSSVEYFVSSFCVEFSLQFKPGVRVRLTFRKMIAVVICRYSILLFVS